MDSQKTTVLSAFYTPSPIVDAIADCFKDKDIKIERVPEPSAGQGTFINSFLKNKNDPSAETLAFEKDLIRVKSYRHYIPPSPPR